VRKPEAPWSADVPSSGVPVPVTTLFLDAGGVLINPNWSRIAEALGRHDVEVTPETLAAAEPRAKKALDRPSSVWFSDDTTRGWRYFDVVLDEARVPRSPATEAAFAELLEYHARRNLWESVPAEVVPCLRRLRADGLGLVVVSNSNGTLRDHLLRLDLLRHFDLVLDSFDEGVEKPDPRLFAVGLERSGARPEATLHVGDFYEVDILGARAAGLRAVLLDPAGLYPDADCPRVRSLTELAEQIETGAL
jgi:putative hydrolase of the HAD superfamily